MNSDDFRQNFDTLTMATRSFLALSGLVSDEDLKQMLQTVSLAEGVGCFVDPTAYRTALDDGRLERQKALIEAHQAFRSSLGAHFTLKGI